jgi:hypothetical protein
LTVTARSAPTYGLALPADVHHSDEDLCAVRRGWRAITVGRTVLRRASWRTQAAERPAEASGIDVWARALGLPRRVFCLVAGEPKPAYVDFQSPALTRNLHRMLDRAASAHPDATVRFSDMLSAPDQCWLEHQGARYTSELRIVAVDRTRRGHGSLTT